MRLSARFCDEWPQWPTPRHVPLSQGMQCLPQIDVPMKRWSSFFQVPCKKIINDAYFCAGPHDSAKPKAELPQHFAKSFAEQVAVLGESSKESVVFLGKASKLIQKTQQHLDGVGQALHEAKEAGLVGRKYEALQAVAANAAKEAEAAKVMAERAKRFCNLATQNANSGPLQKAEQQGRALITEPLISSMEATHGPGNLVTPWSRYASHPPGLYCEQVCENRPNTS
eukprot:s4_g16.t1